MHKQNLRKRRIVQWREKHNPESDLINLTKAGTVRWRQMHNPVFDLINLRKQEWTDGQINFIQNLI